MAIWRLMAEAATFSRADAAAIEPQRATARKYRRLLVCMGTPVALPKRHGSAPLILLVATFYAQHVCRAKNAADQITVLFAGRIAV
ncbi:hypothetical protein [Aurantimonas sp. HBX-1]|uniref:hypothetical protein n=1 Tax=Aurantimonas sp. HBX-1 TaxID=2906072 RepID=UPI001F29C79B|nr:hypothetical protein [Aurantimonas sp. HBX-1]UIJ74294.1 hypothetical protein LXB15_11220 [Aurantimonas sp. HBX-1]